MCVCVCVFVCLFTQVGFYGSCATAVGLRPTAGFLEFYPRSHLPTYERMGGYAGCSLVVNGSDQYAIRTRDALNLMD